MKKICFICMRGGSKELKNKNRKLLYGKPLLFYTINQAIKSKLFNKIVVSTDSKKIQSLAIKYGAETWFLRSKKLSGPSIPKLQVIQDALIKSEKKFNDKFDIIFDLDATSPLRYISDIKNSYKLFVKEEANNLITCCPARKNPYYNMIEYKNNRYNLVKNNNKYSSRQQAPKVYEMNASIYIWKRNYLKKSNNLFNKKTSVYIMPQERSVDIDSGVDFKIVKALL